jgi:hypothetical protein
VDAADLHRLREELRSLAASVAGLADEVAELAPTAESEAAPSWLWPASGRAGRAARADAVAVLLDGLVQWASRVYVRFHDGQLPECWLWHPDVVEELVWLWKAWDAAYRGPAASVSRAGDWHDRQRPGVVRRVRAAAGSCSLREHLDLAEPQTVPVLDAIPAVVEWWTDPSRPAPVPTGEQIMAADAAHQAATVGGRR